MPNLVLSVDIGSTWTKGILVDSERGYCIAREETPTTQDDLTRGFRTVHAALTIRAEAMKGADSCRGGPRSTDPLRAGPGREDRRDGPQGADPRRISPSREGRRRACGYETFISSSAKGGLRIAVVGIVPELTLKAAKMAAASGGGKIVASYSYKLTEEDLHDLGHSRCDIILLSGGTDGGDEQYVLHNARMLAAAGPDAARSDAAVVYAGNRAVRDRALSILKEGGKHALGTDNILPELDRIDIDGARKLIGSLFMERIVRGKGLAELKDYAEGDIRPTPTAVYDLAALLGERMGDLLILDMGGATTDVYSVGEPFSGSAVDRLYRGIPEAKVKRTVEGDLGLRSGAPSALEAATEALAAQAAKTAASAAMTTTSTVAGPATAAPAPVPADGTAMPTFPTASGDLRTWYSQLLGSTGLAGLEAWVKKIGDRGSLLPRGIEEQKMDDILAAVCAMEALARHAGRLVPAYTSSGLLWLQTGKDLTGIRRVIGSGGRLARPDSYPIVRKALEYFDSQEDPNNREGIPHEKSLTPRASALRYFRDSGYMLTLAANLVRKYPDAAVHLMEATLREEG